jgi:acetylornithine/succinyldiaminopimelate/putrescine aminotransferase
MDGHPHVMLYNGARPDPLDLGEDYPRAELADAPLLNNLRPNVLRIAPPLTVTDEEIDAAVEKLDRVLTKIGR